MELLFQATEHKYVYLLHLHIFNKTVHMNPSALLMPCNHQWRLISQNILLLMRLKHFFEDREFAMPRNENKI